MIQKIDQRNFDPGLIWFSDEAHFHLDGYVDKQNWRVWGSENPHLAIQKTMHPRRTTVWAAVSKIGVLGPIFIHESVTSSVYLNEFVNQLQNSPANITTAWFMKDGATPHRTPENFDFIYENFADRVVAQDYPKKMKAGIEWAPYSPDLNPCDFYLWGFIKDETYKTNPKSVEELEEAIKRAFTLISNKTLVKVTENFVLRLRHIIVAGGAPFEHIVS